MRVFLLAGLCLALQGCATSVVKDVVTAPFKLVGKTVDVLTVSKSEKDEKRGRELREKDQELGRLGRKRDDARRKCEDGNSHACTAAEALDAKMQDLL